MLKMSTDLIRHTLNGPTMGTRWSALFFAPPMIDLAALHVALQASVDEVNAQMSTWSPDSDLMRLNAAPVGEWHAVPSRLLTVLQLGLDIGIASDGAFDIGMGTVVTAWGFGPESADQNDIRAAMANPHSSAKDLLDLDLDVGAVRKRDRIRIDLNGIAKGFGTDRLVDTLVAYDVNAALVGIDGEMRSIGLRPNGTPWTIAVETPDHERRAPQSVLTLTDAAVATSGDYRHWVDVQGRRLSHTMDPARGAPLRASPASVTVIAPDCASADAWATALMVLGVDVGARLAQQRGLDALFLIRQADGTIGSKGIGPLFDHGPPPPDAS